MVMLRIYFTYVLLVAAAVGFHALAGTRLLRPWQRWVGYAVLAGCLMGFFWNVSEPQGLFSDFTKAYYPAGRRIWQDPSALYDGAHFVNLPLVAYVFSPLALMDRAAAGWLMAFAGGLAIIGAWALLVRATRMPKWGRIALTGLFLMNGPLYNSLRESNTTHIVLLLLVAAWVCLERKRDAWLGVFLALAGIVKLPLLLLVAPFLLRGRWRVVGAWAGLLVVVLGISVACFGVALHATWFSECVLRFLGRPLGAFNVQSLDGFLARLIYGDAYLMDWDPIEGVAPWFAPIRWMGLAVLVGGTLWVCGRSGPAATSRTQSLELAVALCLALVISPISWSHYYLLLLLPMALALAGWLGIPDGRRWWVVAALGVLLISPPVIPVQTGHPILRPLMAKVLISHIWFGGVVLLGVFLAARWHGARYSSSASFGTPHRSRRSGHVR